MAKNEKTGKKAARLAGELLSYIGKWDTDVNSRIYLVLVNNRTRIHISVDLCSAKDLESVLGSALTQAPDKEVELVEGPKTKRGKGR